MIDILYTDNIKRYFHVGGGIGSLWRERWEMLDVYLQEGTWYDHTVINDNCINQTVFIVVESMCA